MRFVETLKNTFKEIIQEICSEDNIRYKFLSKDWVIMLENYIRLNPNEYTVAKDIYREAIESLFKD